MPFQILGIWFRALLAPLIIGLGIYLLYQWNQHRETWVEMPVTQAEPAEPDRPAGEPPVPATRLQKVSWQWGWNLPTALLVSGLLLLAWSIGGGFAYPVWFRKSRSDQPSSLPELESQRLRRPDGSELFIRACGPRNKPTLIFTHGWGLDGNAWCYAYRELSREFRLVFWDLPGLGSSSSPSTRDWSLEKLADDLHAVVQTTFPGSPVVLVGHSIGGMIIQTYCRLFQQELGQSIHGLVVVHSTYTNPVRTTRAGSIYTAIQKPILEPLCLLMIWLSPLVWLMNWLSYFNGSAHRSTERSSFSGRESREQLAFLTRYYLVDSPAVLARGFLGMFRFDAVDVLPTITIPTLVVAGDGDTVCLPQASTHMAQTIPHAKLVTLPDSKHAGFFEHHDAFHGAMKAFLGSLEIMPKENTHPNETLAATSSGAS